MALLPPSLLWLLYSPLCLLHLQDLSDRFQEVPLPPSLPWPLYWSQSRLHLRGPWDPSLPYWWLCQEAPRAPVHPHLQVVPVPL